MTQQINSSTGDQYEITDLKGKWTGQEVGVNSDIPLRDDGTGAKYIIRQFEFSFNPETLRKIREKKIPAPTQQELFNSHWPQIKIMLWGDGLVAIQEKELPPRMVIGKKKYKIVLLCQPRMGIMVNDKVQTLQEITKPKSLT